MATALKLIPKSATAAVQGRPFREIMKALGLQGGATPKVIDVGRAVQKANGNASAANDGTIPESGRNSTLMRMAGGMRRNGMSEASIDAALQAQNAERCVPPLDRAEVSRIATSVMRYPSAAASEILKSLTDTGNAARFGRSYEGLAKYVFGLGWIIWDSLRWRHDQTEQIVELAKRRANDIHQEGDVLEDGAQRVLVARHAAKSLQAPRLKAMLELAQSLPEMATEANLLNAHDMLLGVGNGVLDLKTGRLRAPRCEDLITRHSPVCFDASATCPKFEVFINQVSGGDSALAKYLQRVVGYSLTGLTTDQCLFFLYGSGANGKSTFLNVIKELLGPGLAKQTPSETLMSNRPSATNDIARLQSVRVVLANEIEDGSLLAESLVKQMTGGEALTARFHYEEFFELLPKFKLFIAGNHKPMIRGRDNGIWRRIRLIPFEVEIGPAQQDKHLQQKLRAELPGILNWAVKGCKAWQRSGLAEPKVVTDSVASYREEMDIIGAWVAECCKVAPSLESKAADAYRCYKFWAEQNGYKPMSAGTFGRDFAVRFKKAKRNDGNYYQGVRVGMIPVSPVEAGGGPRP